MGTHLFGSPCTFGRRFCWDLDNYLKRCANWNCFISIKGLVDQCQTALQRKMKEADPTCQVPIVTSHKEENDIIRNSTKPIVKFMYNRGNNKYSYTKYVVVQHTSCLPLKQKFFGPVISKIVECAGFLLLWHLLSDLQALWQTVLAQISAPAKDCYLLLVVLRCTQPHVLFFLVKTCSKLSQLPGAKSSDDVACKSGDVDIACVFLRSSSDDNMLKNIELFDKLSLRFNGRILFIKDITGDEICVWTYYGNQRKVAEICCTSIVYATEKKQTKVCVLLLLARKLTDRHFYFSRNVFHFAVAWFSVRDSSGAKSNKWSSFKRPRHRITHSGKLLFQAVVTASVWVWLNIQVF